MSGLLPDSSRYTPEQYEYEKIIGKRTSTGHSKLKRLRPVHRKIIGFHIRGLTATETSYVTGFAEAAIYRILRDPLSVEYIQAHTAGVDMELEALAPMAVGALRNGLDSSDERTALNAVDKFFKATGRYNKAEVTAKETAEDVIMRMLRIAENQSGAIQELTRADPASRLVDITPAHGSGDAVPVIEHTNEEPNNGSD